jgi:hypothetical protein
MMTDDQVHDALEYLRTNATNAAEARAHKIYMEEFRKTVKAQAMAKFNNLPVSAQEREAYRSQEYRDHLDAMKIAIHQDEENRWGMVHATSVIEAWRTQNANQRGMGKMV